MDGELSNGDIGKALISGTIGLIPFVNIGFGAADIWVGTNTGISITDRIGYGIDYLWGR